MKIHPITKRKVYWFAKCKDSRFGWMHFQNEYGKIDILTDINQKHSQKIMDHFLETGEIIYCATTYYFDFSREYEVWQTKQ